MHKVAILHLSERWSLFTWFEILFIVNLGKIEQKLSRNCADVILFIWNFGCRSFGTKGKNLNVSNFCHNLKYWCICKCPLFTELEKMIYSGKYSHFCKCNQKIMIYGTLDSSVTAVTSSKFSIIHFSAAASSSIGHLVGLCVCVYLCAYLCVRYVFGTNSQSKTLIYWTAVGDVL